MTMGSIASRRSLRFGRDDRGGVTEGEEENRFAEILRLQQLSLRTTEKGSGLQQDLYYVVFFCVENFVAVGGVPQGHYVG